MRPYKVNVSSNYGSTCCICEKTNNGIGIYDDVDPNSIYGCATDVFICMGCLKKYYDMLETDGCKVEE